MWILFRFLNRPQFREHVADVCGCCLWGAPWRHAVCLCVRCPELYIFLSGCLQSLLFFFPVRFDSFCTFWRWMQSSQTQRRTLVLRCFVIYYCACRISAKHSIFVYLFDHEDYSTILNCMSYTEHCPILFLMPRYPWISLCLNDVLCAVRITCEHADFEQK